MKLLMLSIATALGFGVAEAHAACLDKAQVGAMLREFSFTREDEKFSAKGLDLCKEDSAPTKTLAALIYLKKYSRLPTLSPKIDQQIMGSDAWRFLKERIRRIDFTADGTGSCGDDDPGPLHTLAYVEIDSDPETMHICNFFGQDNLLDAAQTLVHEARHNQGYAHVDCTRGALRNSSRACDESYGDQGSYATGVEYNIRLAKHQDVDPVIREASRAEALTDLYQRFNEVPFGFKEIAVIQDVNGAVYTFDGKNLAQFASGTGGQVMAERSGAPILFDPSTGSVNTFSLGALVDAAGKIAGRFREGLEPSLRQTLVDAAYTDGDDGSSCLLFQHELRCYWNKTGASEVRLALTKIRPVGLIYRASSTLVKNKVLYIAGDDGLLYALPTTYAALKKSAEKSFKPSKRPVTFREVAGTKTGAKQELVLGRDGKVYATSSGEKGLKPVPQLNGLSVKAIVSPVSWSKELQGI